jgi:hypothetical protein
MIPEWRPYQAHSPRSRVREFFVRGDTEFELLVEGGAELIRRTVRTSTGRIVRQEEAARGRLHLVVTELWMELRAEYAA